jgi:hemerythrin
VESLNRLHSAIHEGRGEEEVGWCLSFLKAYTRVHFRTEETILAAYPGFDGVKHIEAHHLLQNKVDDLFRSFLHRKEDLSQTTLETLKTWLLDHIQGEDKTLLKELRSHQLTISAAAPDPYTAK